MPVDYFHAVFTVPHQLSDPTAKTLLIGLQ
jgi:hypothetical protein